MGSNGIESIFGTRKERVWVTLTKAQLEQCERYTCGIMEEKKKRGTRERAQSRDSEQSLDRIRQNFLEGKIGEVGVHSLLSRYIPTLKQPDFDLHEHPSWLETDLRTGDEGLRIHIKTCRLHGYAYGLGPSWVISRDDESMLGTGSSSSNHMICFASYEESTNRVSIDYIVQVRDLHEKKLFKQMMKVSVGKAAVYCSYELVPYYDVAPYVGVDSILVKDDGTHILSHNYPKGISDKVKLVIDNAPRLFGSTRSVPTGAEYV